MTSHPAMVALLVVVGLAYAQAHPRASGGCCLPDTFESTLVGLSNYYNSLSNAPKVTVLNSRVSYDWSQKKKAMTAINDKGAVSYKVIQDFNQMKEYLIKGDSCTYYKLVAPYERACTHSYKSYPYTIGVGEQSLKMMAYEKVTDYYDDIIKVITPDCVPAGENIIVQTGLSSYVSQNYDVIDITMGIKDPSVFTPPKNCQGGWKINEMDRLTKVNRTRVGLLGMDFLHV